MNSEDAVPLTPRDFSKLKEKEITVGEHETYDAQAEDEFYNDGASSINPFTQEIDGSIEQGESEGTVNSFRKLSNSMGTMHSLRKLSSSIRSSSPPVIRIETYGNKTSDISV